MNGTNPYAYASNPATGFLDSAMNSYGGGYGAGGAMQGGVVGQQFANVMNSMSSGVTRNAQMGIVPGGINTNQMTPQQIAAQMNYGGPMSVLPYLGNSFLPKLVYPVAGLWSLYDGIKSVNGMRQELAHERATNARFDPSQLSYNQVNADLDASNELARYGFRKPHAE